MSHQSGIYEIVNTVNGKRYIGSAADFGSRWRAHRSSLRRGVHRNSILQRAWNKYGAGAFEFSVLLVCTGDRKSILAEEQRFLGEYMPEYNIASCATAAFAGRRHSSATKEKISASNTGRKISADIVAQIASKRRGVSLGPQSAEHRMKIAAAKTGYITPQWVREKISAAKKAKNQLKEQRA